VALSSASDGIPRRISSMFGAAERAAAHSPANRTLD
jgi:hypothetical protein